MGATPRSGSESRIGSKCWARPRSDVSAALGSICLPRSAGQPDAPRGAMGEAYAIRDALSVMAGLVQVKPGHDDTGRFGDAMSSHSG
jgi:hypothetical protein